MQVKGKVNALSVDSCQRLGILFEDLVSSCELINSSRIQVQVTGVVPTIAIDKCDGVQVSTPHWPTSHLSPLHELHLSFKMPGCVAAWVVSCARKGCVVVPTLTAGH